MRRIISTVNDIRNWVEERVGNNADESDIAEVTKAIQNDKSSPAYGRDWSEYFANLPENLFELVGPKDETISLLAFNNEKPITYLWICGVSSPTGTDFNHNTDTEDEDDYCDFAELNVIEKLWELEGTEDEHGRWCWNGKGDVRDMFGNTIYNVKARR